jgi:hypothetical protein
MPAPRVGLRRRSVERPPSVAANLKPTSPSTHPCISDDPRTKARSKGTDSDGREPFAGAFRRALSGLPPAFPAAQTPATSTFLLPPHRRPVFASSTSDPSYPARALEAAFTSNRLLSDVSPCSAADETHGPTSFVLRWRLVERRPSRRVNLDRPLWLHPRRGGPHRLRRRRLRTSLRICMR